MSKPEVNSERRNFLLGPLNRLKEVGSHLRRPENASRLTDNAVEFGGEVASLLAIMWLAYQGSKDKLVTYNVDSESSLRDLAGYRDKLLSIDRFVEVLGGSNTQVSQLDARWEREYYKDKTVLIPQPPETVCSGTGKSRICRTVAKPPKPEKVYYWDEPDQLRAVGVDHNQIRSWSDTLRAVSGKVSKISVEAPEAFDLSKGDSKLFYTEKTVDAGSQMLLAIPLYSLVGASFVFYEEVFRKLAETGSTSLIVDDAKYIKRRTFLKLAASVGLALKIRDFEKLFVVKNKNLLPEIREHTASVIASLDTDPENNFKRFFGKTPIELRNTFVDLRDKTVKAQQTGYVGLLDFGWVEVLNHLKATSEEADRSVKAFDQYFSYNAQTREYTIPDDLTEITKYLRATEEIVNYVQSRSTDASTKHLVNALFMFLGLGAVALVGETAFPAIDTIFKKPKDDDSESV